MRRDKRIVTVEKEIHERSVQPHAESKPNYSARQRINHADLRPFAYAFDIARAAVLPRICGDRRTERVKRLRGKVVDLRRRNVARIRADVYLRHTVERLGRRWLLGRPGRTGAGPQVSFSSLFLFSIFLTFVLI